MVPAVAVPFAVLSLVNYVEAAEPAKACHLLQSARDLGQGKSQPPVEEGEAAQTNETKVHIDGIFFNFYTPLEVSAALMETMRAAPPDDADQLLQGFFLVILALFLCALLALVIGVEEARPKMAAEPFPGCQPSMHRSSTSAVVRAAPLPRAVGLAAQSTASARPVDAPPSWPPSRQPSVRPRTPSLGPPTPPRAPERDSSPVGTPSLQRGTASASAVGPVAPLGHHGSRGLGRKTPHLCHGLVVPSGSECVLAVRLPPAGNWSQARADVMDLTGKAVLVVMLRRAAPQVPGRSRDPVVELKPTSSTPNTALNQTLAQCYTSRGSEDEVGVDICKASGEIYGRLVRDPTRPRYVMTRASAPGLLPTAEIVFDGLFDEHAVLASETTQNEPMADAEPCGMSFDPEGKYFRLRVSSNVDVGLIICCLLSIDELVRMGA